MSAGVSADLTARIVVAARGVDVALTVPAGRTLALLGPNGSGKSTVVEVLAGLLVPDAAEVRLGDRLLARVEGGRVLDWVPPHRRRVVLLAQRPLLFGGLSVLGNVAFGPRAAGASRRDAAELARHWLAEVGALDLAARRPHRLSGGQQQRVALARALAANPELLLLDEPLAALDSAGQESIRELLARVLAGRTAVLISHDPADAAALAADVLRLEHGTALY